MTDGVGVRIEGLSRLRRDLKDLEDNDGVALLGDTMRRVEDIVIDAAFVRVPRRTGRLSASTVGSSSKVRARVTATAIYAGPIHWGWASRGIDAQPWLSEAATESEPVWAPVVAQGIQDVLDRVEGA